jgi:hypothetical protein
MLWFESITKKGKNITWECTEIELFTYQECINSLNEQML